MVWLKATGMVPVCLAEDAGRERAGPGSQDQALMLDEVHDRHDEGGCASSMPSSCHDRSEVRQELIERLLALPDIEDLKLAILTEA